MASLSEAISLGKEAFQLTKVELIDLGDLYLQRFQRTENATDLYEAISCQEKAVHLILEGDLDMTTQLGTLGNFVSNAQEIWLTFPKQYYLSKSASSPLQKEI